MIKHFAVVQSQQRQTFACPSCGPLRLEDLGSHCAVFQFDLTREVLTLARPHSVLTPRRHHAPR